MKYCSYASREFKGAVCVRCFYTKVEDKWEMYLFCGCEMIYIYKCCVCLRMSGIDEVEF